MATIADGNWLNQFVAPQLLVEFKNYNDDFLAALKSAPRQALTADGIRFNKLINNVGFLVDNTAEFTAKPMSGKKVFVPWEKYDTEPTSVDDSEIRYLNYDKRSAVRVKHTEAFKMGFRDHVMWKLAPDDDTSSDMPVMRTTGADDGTGRKRLTFADLVKYLELVKNLNLPNAKEFYMVLCPEHSTDLILDRDSAAYFADKKIFFDPITGKVNSVMGFKFYENNAALAYDATGNKLAKGAALTATDRRASLFFYGDNTVKHIEKVKILYKPEVQDTTSADPTSEFRTQTYGLIDRIEDYGVGAIVSGIVA
ncbi:hypothetical protein [Carboxylicivirga linearis]|uniref:Major capsid protein n=1 Tax=Carboxylicivirga linearis TaxID=1628157 RepID=A0ABS5JWH8_9BACT|nr:hypothetical protein [Carboxylicivirga linearis]MBS2099184.1 hypothetical protein [Carboxylicivirga linearis]